MELRTEIAALVMAGIRANHDVKHTDPRTVARMAVQDADALIEELERSKKPKPTPNPHYLDNPIK